jgi:hypothetical protein
MTASNDSRCFHVAVSHMCTSVELLWLCSTHCLFHHFAFCSSLLRFVNMFSSNYTCVISSFRIQRLLIFSPCVCEQV